MLQSILESSCHGLNRFHVNKEEKTLLDGRKGDPKKVKGAGNSLFAVVGALRVFATIFVWTFTLYCVKYNGANFIIKMCVNLHMNSNIHNEFPAPFNFSKKILCYYVCMYMMFLHLCIKIVRSNMIDIFKT